MKENEDWSFIKYILSDADAEFPENLTEAQKRELFEYEELIVAAMYISNQKDMESRIPEDEEEDIACSVDQIIQDAQNNQGRLSSRTREIFQIMKASLVMSDPWIATRPVPEALQNIVKSVNVSKKVPSLLLRLSQSGLNAVKSTFQGFYIQPEAFVETRSASTIEKKPRLTVRQTLSSDPEDFIECQIVRESDTELMLSLSLPRKAASSRIDLRKDSRMIDSQRIDGTNSLASFSRLTAGEYDVEISGAITNSFSLMVESNEL